MLICSYLVSRPHAGGGGRRKRKPTDKEVFVLASFLELQIHLKRWNLEPGAKMRPPGAAPPLGALCAALEAAVTFQRREDETASGASGAQWVLAAAPCPRAPARITLRCEPAALQEPRPSLLPGGRMTSSLGRWASRGPPAHSARGHGLLPSPSSRASGPHRMC